jgi:hypothetical protein
MLIYIALILLGFTFMIKEGFTCVNPETIKVISTNNDPFIKSTFKPECCPSMYSSSQGCLCLDETVHGILASRGGNRMLDPL